MEEWILLPQPQRLSRLEGVHRFQAGRLIWLEGDAGALLRTGQSIQESLAAIGPPWELTAAQGRQPSLLGAIVQVDPHQIPPPEGYALTIGREQIRLVAHDPAGAFYGAMTLKQIARQAEGRRELPCCRIEDWPAFPHRGVMLDISRDKVPRMETLRMLVDQLAEWKINQLQLYTEHTFAYRNHREVWENASPMTGEQILELDAYCRERFMELVPNQNSFGHLTRWLVHPRYQHLAEAPNGCETVGGWQEDPFSLCPLEPGSLQLLAEWFGELLPHFSSRLFNVGCDETVDLGRGKSRAVCEERGVGRVYLDFLLQIHNLVQQHGRTMQFWGDIIMHHPELISELPGDLIALEWGYEADHPFAADGEKFARAGVPYYVCPGTSSWNTLAGRTDNAVGNLWNAAENGQAQGAIGYLITDWGDNGHWQPLPVSFLGYAYGAAVSWCPPANRNLDLPRALDRHAFQDAAGVMGRLAYDLGNAYQQPGVLLPNSSILNLLLLHPEQSLTQGRWAELTVEALERSQAYLEQTLSRLPEAHLARSDADQVADEFRLAGALLLHACRLGIARLQAGRGAVAQIPTGIRQELARELEALIAEYRRQWLVRNRPGGLEESAGRLEKLLSLYRGEGGNEE